MRHVLVALAIAVAVTAVGMAFVRDQDRSQPDIGALLEDVIAQGAPGALVVLRDRDEVRTDARGFADPDRSTPMRASARFRIGSVTKTFVATLVLQLVEDGRIGLDDTVERWLPGLITEGRRMTVRHLLSHTTGLFDYVEDPSVLRDHDRRWTPRALVSVALSHPPTHDAPGSRFAYSSTNYVVLGLIAEKAGRAGLARQLERRLFRPLGLRRTSFVNGLIRGVHVHGHRPPSHQGIVTGPPADTSDEPAWWTGAAGAIVSTAADVQRFFEALLSGRVLGPTLLREMETVVPAGKLEYGLGLATFPTPCGKAWGHTGNVQGTIAIAWNTVDASRQLVIVVNTYPLSPELDSAVRRLQDAAFCAGS